MAKFIEGKSKNLDFSKPIPNLVREDDWRLREKILFINYEEWEKMGFSKGTLHYIKRKIKKGEPLKLNKHVRKRMEAWEM